MSKDKLTDYSATNASNTDIGGINIDEGMLPSAVNNSIRELLTHLKNFSDGTDAITGLTVDGNIKLDGNYPTGSGNVALGNQALDDGSLSGNNNTAVGADALSANTTGTQNTAIGYGAGDSTTTGSYNVFVGRLAGDDNTTGSDNTAAGRSSFANNTTGSDNVAIGSSALLNNSTASNNVAVGKAALEQNTTGTENVAVGAFSLDANTTASNNVGIGRHTLGSTTTGGGNVAVGDAAGISNQTGTFNTYVGGDAGSVATGGSNTFVGRYAGGLVTSGAKNTIIGLYNGNQGGVDIRTSSNDIVISDGDGNPRIFYDNSLSAMIVSDLQSASGLAQNATIKAVRNQGSRQISFARGGNSTGGGGIGAENGTALNVYNDSGTRVARVATNGDVTTSTGSYGTISDERVKENIVDSGSQWDDVKAMRVRKYSLIEDELDEANQLGVIAQELEASGMNGLVDTSTTFLHADDDTPVERKSVKYSILYMKAVKALQEAMTRIEALETKVAALEAE